MKYRNILFDLDGTLTDPGLGITRSVQYALAKFGIDEPDLTNLYPFIGPPLHISFMTYYSFPEEKAWDAVNYYREYYSDRGMLENEVYEGIPLLLSRLKDQHRNLYVATSKPVFFASQIVRHFHLEKFFSAVHGSELDGRRTDKVELIQHLIDKEMLDPTETVMIGDRKFDLLGAKLNHIDSIAVGYGYGKEPELLAEHPTYYFKTLTEMTESFP